MLLVGVEFNAPLDTVYRSFRRRSSQPITWLILTNTRSSAIAEGPRDASCQLKSCQLPRNSAETTYTTSPDQIDGMKLEFSRRQCVIDNVHSTMTRSSRLPLSQVSNKPTTLSCVYHLSTDNLLWPNFLSPQCINCSRDPDHAHLGSTLITRLRLHMADPCTKSEVSSISRCGDITWGVKL